MTTPKRAFHPIVFLRGFAMRGADIEAAADQVYTGFNDGSTKVRQTSTGRLERFFFESVVVRLMKDPDLGYVDGYRDGRLQSWEGTAPQRSFWVFRYYDLASKAFGESRRLDIEHYARELRRFLIDTVRPSVCGDDAEKKRDFKVHLVAHSMGGLVARCYLQNICRLGTGDADLDRALELETKPADSLVHRFFTYGAPHNGIELLGINVPDLGDVSITQARTFNRENMTDFLRLDRPDRHWDHERHGVHSLDGAIDPSRVFNLIGTNGRDYDLPSKHVTGERGDGLVMMANAYTSGPAKGSPTTDPGKPGYVGVYSPRAYAHRSHGGPMGMVNSEIGYQNLRRFLFGTHRIDVTLDAKKWTYTPEIQQRIDEGLKPEKVKFWYYVNVSASLRGLDQLLHERSEANASALVLDPRKDFATGKELTLFTGFMDEALIPAGRRTMVGHLRVEIGAPRYEIDHVLRFDEELPGAVILSEQFRFSVTPDEEGPAVVAERRSPTGSFAAVPEARRGLVDGGVFEWRTSIGFDPNASPPPPGSIAADLIVRVRPHV